MNAERYLTIEEAALELAELTFDKDNLLTYMSSLGIPETSFDNMKAVAIAASQKDFNNQIMSATEHDALVVRNPANKLPYILTTRRDFFEVISITDINAWLEQNGIDYRLDKKEEPQQKKGRRENQFAAIVQQAKALGYSPLSIAYGGKNKIKNECLKDFEPIYP